MGHKDNSGQWLQSANISLFTGNFRGCVELI
jgi:hypothetical protein